MDEIKEKRKKTIRNKTPARSRKYLPYRDKGKKVQRGRKL
jgi:hypothetical protein